MFAIGLTDQAWLEYLRDEPPANRINFWTPTPWNIRRLHEGDRWYFLLKAPVRKLGGYGYFSKYKDLSIEQAWQKFGVSNGVASKSELLHRCAKYSGLHSVNPAQGINSIIGCIVLTAPVFFDDDELVDLASVGISVPRQVVKFKYFDGNGPTVASEREGTARQEETFKLVGDEPSDYSRQRRKDRKGQARFRDQLMQSYGHRCAITGETQEKILEATHIEPYVNEGGNHVQNGILMRVDLHRLFDAGLLAVDHNMGLLVSSWLEGS